MVNLTCTFLRVVITGVKYSHRYDVLTTVYRKR